jgi:polysaccharide biosynthesis/export protein
VQIIIKEVLFMKLKIATLLILIAGLFQAAFAQDIVAVREEQKGYLIGPGDVITIKVMGEPDFNTEATIVDEDGKIQVAFSETGIFAKCRTEKELRDDVVKQLSKYLRNPQINLYVKERNSRPKVTIFGEVRKPEQVVLTRKARLLEILAGAGGVTEKAGGMIQVFRPQAPICSDPAAEAEWKAESNNGLDVPSRLYSLGSLRQGSDQSNPLVFPGDIIVVQEALPVFVVGEVNATGKLLLPEGGLPMTEAIARVGGVRPGVKTRDIKIYRLKPNSKDRDVIAVNYDHVKQGKVKDVMLEPYDIVEVDKAKKGIGDILLDIVTKGGEGVLNTLPIRVL